MTQPVEDAARRLAELLAQENAALKRMDFPAAIALVPAKQAALAQVSQHNAPVPPARAPALLALRQTLAALAEENRVLLETAITVQTRIVQMVARAVAPAPNTACYRRPNERTRTSRTMALAMSQSA
jgi:hypothetical protein